MMQLISPTARKIFEVHEFICKSLIFYQCYEFAFDSTYLCNCKSHLLLFIVIFNLNLTFTRLEKLL